MDYYSRHWDRMKLQLGGEFETLYRPVIGAMATASGPLKISNLVVRTALTEQQILHALRTWRPFLSIGRDNEEQHATYQFYHQSFNDFLAVHAKDDLKAMASDTSARLLELVGDE